MTNKPLFPLPAPQEPQSEKGGGKPRVQRPNRQQLEWRPVDLESLLAPDHPARLVWEFVQHLDLSPWYAHILAVEGSAGRDAIDPAILAALWLMATLDGVGSARALERLCQEHDAYRWICGGVSVNYHTLANFRVAQPDWLDRLLTESVTALIADGLVTLQRVAQDGMHVRASAGSSSFRRKPKLEEHLQVAQAQVARLRNELDNDPQATSKRQQAARQRAAQQRQERVQKALKRLEELEAEKQPNKKSKGKTQPADQPPTQPNRKSDKRPREPRASTTDPQARIMKMANGGFRPAYDVQFATDTATQAIAGVKLNNQGNDKCQLGSMLDYLKQRYGFYPKEALIDGGYEQHEDFDRAAQKGVVVYSPPSQYARIQSDPYAPQPADSPLTAEWRKRMATEEAQQIYKQRSCTAECVNAIATNRGLTRFLVRGMEKVRAVALWYALLHTLLRGRALRLAAAQA